MSYVKRNTARPGTTRRGRMLGYQYSQPGYYFVTICTHERQHLFGQVTNRTLSLSPAAQMVHELIPETETKFATVSVNSYVVMPNHVHILIGLAIGLDDEPDLEGLSMVVKWLKSTAVRRYGLGVRDDNWPRYNGRLWQAGFHDHIVRNDRELETLRRYIATNVESWGQDRFHDY